MRSTYKLVEKVSRTRGHRGSSSAGRRDEDEDNTDFPKVLELGRQGKEKEKKIGEHLQEHQKDEQKALFAVYADVFSDNPEKSDLIKCKLTLKDNAPCKQALMECLAR